MWSIDLVGRVGGGRSVSTWMAMAMATPRVREHVQVSLGRRSYPILVGRGLLQDGEVVQEHMRGRKALLVSDDRVAPLHAEKVRLAMAERDVKLHEVVLPAGERHKTMDSLCAVLDAAVEARLDRTSTVMALGGGVVGDVAGFAASCYARGVGFVQMPTTVMAMVDSSVGGKTAVNHPKAKNMIGAFYQPQLVLADLDALDTLPERERNSGLAEVVKYGLIGDPELFAWLEAHAEDLVDGKDTATAYAVKRSCENKAMVVAQDEQESGIRATLNLGHTFGHAIEAGMGYGEWLHGEAVAAGMVMAAHMSKEMGWIDGSVLDRTVQLLERCKLPVRPPPGMTVKTFQDLMAIDKKVADGKLRLVLLRGELGQCVVTGDFDPDALRRTLEHFCDA